MRERWKDIEGYEGRYQVSDLGRIKSLPKSFYCGKNNSTFKTYPETILKNVISVEYVVISLHKEGKQIREYVHILVAKAFVKGYKPGLEVNHLDGNKQNNYYKNLEWDTHAGNQKHAAINKLMATGEKHGNSIFTKNQVESIRKDYSNKISQQRIADNYKCSRGAIQKIVTNKNWK